MLSLIRSGVAWLSRSLENPRRPLDPWSQALGHSADGSMSSAGVRVDRDKALTYSAVWRAASLISRTAAKLPLAVYRAVRPGREHAPDHAADWLLRKQPNEWMTPFVWKQLVTLQVLMDGNHFSAIIRNGGGIPVELLPLDPDRTWPVREQGRLWYVHELRGGEMRKLPPDDVLHVKGMGYDGLEGYSVLAKARDSIGGALAAQSYAGTFYRNSARPNVALKHPQRLSPEARKNLRESWERLHQGIDNSHRTAILEEGVDVVQLQINAKDAQMIESRQFSLLDVANWFNLPPHRLGANVSTSYGSLEQENQNFLDDAIDPWLVAIEEECEAKLLTSHQRGRDTHAIAFDRFPLVRADVGERGTFYESALTNGWLSPDEVRAREGLNPMPGGIGKVYFFPAGASVVGNDPDGTGPAVAPGTKLLGVPDVRQDAPYACGAAAVRAVCQFYGTGPQSEAEAIEQLGTTPAAGTSPTAVVSLLSRIGLAVVAEAGLGVESLASHFAASRPVLCPIQADSPGGTQGGHWVVVIGTGLGYVFVHDPVCGRRMIADDDWLARWHDRDAVGNKYERYGIAVAEEIALTLPLAGGSPSTPIPTPTPDAASLAAGRTVLLDAVGRVVRRIGHAARRAAGEPAKFLAWLDRMPSEHGETVGQMLAAPLAAAVAARACVQPASPLGEAILAELRQGMLELSGQCGRSTLQATIDRYVSHVEGDPSTLAAWHKLEVR